MSSYGNEDERLFLGGAGDGLYGAGGLVQFRSIRLTKTKKDMLWFVRGLSLFDIIINGGKVSNWKKFSKSCIWYFKLICDLLCSIKIKIKIVESNEKISSKKNKYPKYIKYCLTNLINNKKIIKINLFAMNFSYKPFKSLFISSSCPCPNMLLFDNICNMFKNCTQIQYNMWTNWTKFKISKEYICLLLDSLSKFVNNKLNKIILIDYKFDNDINFEKCLSLFKKKNSKWNIKHIERKNEINDQDGYSDLHIFCVK